MRHWINSGFEIPQSGIMEVGRSIHMKKKDYIITGQFAGIAALVATVLTGCGYQLTGEPETRVVLYADSIFANESAEPGDSSERQDASAAEDPSGQQETSEQQEPSEAETQESFTPEDKFRYDQYAAILNDWTLAEGYGDLSYLQMYFGEDYLFDSYWLCDVDQNGVPELFLHSSTMGITAVFTCTEEQPVFLTYDNFYGINPEMGELVIHGHWHGAGGSYENEWTAYQVLPDKAEYTMYIDFFDLSEDGEENRYTVYNPETGEYVHSTDGAEYEALYAAHVQSCITMDNYTLYDCSDLSGLDRIQ